MTTATLTGVYCKFCESIRDFFYGVIRALEFVDMAGQCSELCRLGKYEEAQDLCRKKLRIPK